MRKIITGLSIISVTILSIFVIEDKQVHAVSTAEVHLPRLEQVQNKTIAAAVSQFKDKDMNYAETYFTSGNADLNTKLLAIKENGGYGFLAGSAESSFANGTREFQNADTDPNSATVGDILAAITKSHQEK